MTIAARWPGWAIRIGVSALVLGLALAGTARAEALGETSPPGAEGDAAPRPSEYKARLLEEASTGESSLSTTGETGAGQSAEEGAAESGAGDQGRIDAIKSAVSDALADSPEMTPPALEPSTLEPEAAMPASARRELLQDLVVDPPVPEDALDADYVGELRKEVAETLVLGKAAPSRPDKVEPASVQAAARASPGLYRVQHGDSLWSIAEAQLGSGYRWVDIYRANRKVLRSANVLRVGQSLTIP